MEDRSNQPGPNAPVGARSAKASPSSKPAVKRKPKKSKNTKKPADMPRRPLSAYNIFFKHTRGVILAEREDQDAEEDPDVPANSKGASLFAQLGRSIARRWKELPDDEMAKYKAMAEDDMKRYRKEMEEYHLAVARKTRIEALGLPTAASNVALTTNEDIVSAEDVKLPFRSSIDSGISNEAAPSLAQLDGLHLQRALAAERLAQQQNLLQLPSYVAGADILSQTGLGITGGLGSYDQLAQLQQIHQLRELQQLQAGGLAGSLGLSHHNSMDPLLASRLSNPSLSLGGFGAGAALNSHLGSPDLGVSNLLDGPRFGANIGQESLPPDLGGLATPNQAQSSEYQLALLQHQHLLRASAEQRELEQNLVRRRVLLQQLNSESDVARQQQVAGLEALSAAANAADDDEESSPDG